MSCEPGEGRVKQTASLDLFWLLLLGSDCAMLLVCLHLRTRRKWREGRKMNERHAQQLESIESERYLLLLVVVVEVGILVVGRT